MTTTQMILKFASEQRGPFRRKDLLRCLFDLNEEVKENSIDILVNRLLDAGKLQRTGRGEYILNNNCFIYHPSHFEQEIFAELKKYFPLLDFCIWSPKVLSSLMLHVPNIGYTFVDVEKDGMEPVFHKLQSIDLGKNILISPSETDCERYLTGTDSIVVRQLIGRSPVTEINGCTVPMIEKILTDSVGDNELAFTGGSEIFNIFETAFERYDINQAKMLAYASRRNRKDTIEQILKTINYDKPQKPVS